MENFIVKFVVPLILAFIIFCITPFFAKVRNRLFGFFENINKSFSDSIYKNAAKESLTGPLSFLAHIIVLVILIVLTNFYTDLFISYKVDFEGFADKRIEKLANEIDETKGSPEFKEKLLEILSNEQEKIKTILLIAVGILMLFILFYLLIKWMKNEIINYHIINFNHHLRIIRPYISDKEFHEIKQNWALMENKDDWEKIADKIELIKNKNLNTNA